MKYSDLLTVLGVVENAIPGDPITINAATFGDDIGRLLRYGNGNQPLILKTPQLKSVKADRYVDLRATANFLGVPDLPCHVRFFFRKSRLQMRVRFTLLGDNPGANEWKFSKSFPDLPQVVDAAQPIAFDRATGATEQTFIYPLDQYYFYHSRLVLTSWTIKDSEFDVRLHWGINFLSYLKPEGALGVLTNVFQYTPRLSVHGTIRLPQSEETPQSQFAAYYGRKALQQYPWEVQDQFERGLPGILLRIGLDLSYPLVEGKIQFSADELLIYTPLNTAWIERCTNPRFEPTQAYTGAIALPEADLSLDMVSEFEYGIDALAVRGQFEGFSLNNFAQLAGLTGSEADPIASLPDIIRDVGDELGSLELMSFHLGIAYPDPSAITLESAVFQVGMPELKLEIFEGLFELNGLSAMFDFSYPFVVPGPEPSPFARQMEIVVQAGMEVAQVPFAVSAAYSQGFAFYASLSQRQSLPLTDILRTYAPGVPAPAEVGLDLLRFSIAPGEAYSMALALANGPHPMRIPVGPTDLVVSDITMGLHRPQNGSTTGTLSGTTQIGDLVTLHIAYDLPGDIIIRSLIREVSLMDLLGELTNQLIPAPPGFDLTLQNCSLLMEKRGVNYNFQLVTEVEDFGSFALEVRKVGSKWGAATGLNLTQGTPSALPGLGVFRALEDAVALQRFMFVLSSFEAPNFQFPDLAQFNNPHLSSTSVPLPASAGGLVAGLNVYASWQLDTDQKEMQLLRDILGLAPELDVTLQLGKNPARDASLFLNFDTQLAGQPLSAQFGLVLNEGKPELFLAGYLFSKLQGQRCRFDVGMSLVTGGIYFAGSMQGAVDFGPFTLSNLALALGFNWAGIPSFGFAGSLNLPDFQTSVALMLDSTDPTKSLLAGAISDISLADITTLIAGAAVPEDIAEVLESIAVSGTRPFALPAALHPAFDERDLPAVAAAFLQYGKAPIPETDSHVLLVTNRRGESWSLTDQVNNLRHYQIERVGEELIVTQNAQLYLAPARTQIGNLQFPQGFFLNGALSLLGLTWTTQIDVREGRGAAASSNLDQKLVLVSPRFFQLSDVAEKTGPSFSMATFVQPEVEDPVRRLPHLVLDGLVCVSGLKTHALVSATRNGFVLDVGQVTPLKIGMPGISGKFVMDWRLRGHLLSPSNLAIAGELQLSLNGEIALARVLDKQSLIPNLGGLALNLNVAGKMESGYDGKKAFLRFSGGFRFQGSQYEFDLDLNASNADLNDAAELVYRELIKIIKELYDTAGEWLQALEDGWVAFTGDVEEMANVLKAGYQQSAAQTTRLLKNASQSATEIAGALRTSYRQSLDQSTVLLKQHGFHPNATAKALKSTYRASAGALSQALKRAGIAPKDLAAALHYADPQLSIPAAAAALNTAGISPNQIAEGLQSSFNAGAQATAQALANTQIATDQITGALEEVYAQSAQEAIHTLAAIGKAGPEIGTGLKAVYGYSAQQAALAMKAQRIPVDEIGDALKSAYKQDAKTLTRTLRNVGFNQTQVTTGLESAYQVGMKSAAVYLRSAGIGPDNTAKALREVYRANSDQVAAALRHAGRSYSETARALKGVYRASAETAARSINRAGYSNDDLARVLRDVYRLDSDGATQVYRKIGKSADDAAKMLRHTYDKNAEQAAKKLRKGYDISKSSAEKALKSAGFKSKNIKKGLNKAWKSATGWF
ncbi:MAG: hypothetical protein AAGN35_06135 [Bacteroidota bacterium]